jgi:hypothetical protein
MGTQQTPKHHRFGASGAETWMTCAAAIQAQEGKPDTPSIHAQTGTVAHHVAEQCLLNGTDAIKWKGQRFESLEGEKFIEPIIVDTEMVEALQLYIDYCRNLPGEHHVEQRVDLSTWTHDGFGTADYIAVHENVLTVVDLKYGYTPVDAYQNKQLSLYALGALEEYDNGQIDTIRLVVWQPRVRDEADVYELTTAELYDFGVKVKHAVDRALSKEPTFTPSEKGCRWCKAKPTCRALADTAQLAAIEGFKPMTQQLTIRNATELTKEETAQIMLSAGAIRKFLDAVEENALHAIRNGETLPGVKAVEGQSNRKWIDEDKAEKVLARAKFKEKERFKLKLLTPTQALKEWKIRGLDEAKLEKHYTRPPGKLKLVPESAAGKAVTFTKPTDGFAPIDDSGQKPQLERKVEPEATTKQPQPTQQPAPETAPTTEIDISQFM